MPDSVILNGITGAHPGGIGNFFGNDLDLQLAGGLFEFSPFSLTDHTIDFSGGYGTVEVLGPSSLVDNSALILGGPNANLINDGKMRLQHAQLTIGGSLAGTGSVIAMQGSTITALSTVPSKEFYLPGWPKPDPTVTATSTFPSEAIRLHSSTLDISAGAVSFQAPITMDATSTVNLEGSLIVAAGQSFTVRSTGPKLGTLDNKEGVDVSGTMTVDANLAQPGNNGDTSSTSPTAVI